MKASPFVGQRLPFAQAPEPVRRWVTARLGGPVQYSRDCVGGMSPGPAACVAAAGGATAFVKACGPELNPHTPDLLRAEARVLAALPETAALPRLIDVYDDAEWVALLIEEVPGRPPATPWAQDDLRLASQALVSIRRALDAADPGVELPPGSEAPFFASRWRQMAAHLGQLDPWWGHHADQLTEHAEQAAGLLAGPHLVHWDVRADNMVRNDAGVVLVDWGQARRGAAWSDHAFLALDCAMSGAAISMWQFAASDQVLQGHGTENLLAVASAAAMSFAVASLEPAPQGLPTMPRMRTVAADNLRRALSGMLD